MVVGKQNPFLEKGDSDEEELNESSKDDFTQLADSVFVYQNRVLSDHGNVFEGEVRSGVYGIRVCAIKFARKSEQNVKEAIVLTRLGSHPHVISLIESGFCEYIFEERVFIALDKCHEHNLQQHLIHQNESGVEFNLDEALEYSKQIIAGLTYVHENLIIHKDLEPSNILLSRNKSTIKLADFGLSQEIKSTSSKVYCSNSFGTNGFRPSESFGRDWASLKSDTFSVGAVLYYLLSNGKSPLGDEITLWIHKTRSGEIDLSNLLVANAKSFQHLIQLMLSKDRCRRPSIWQVADHPCWTGKDTEFDFDYGCSEEVDDCDVILPQPKEQNSGDSNTEMECFHELPKAIEKMGCNTGKSEFNSVCSRNEHRESSSTKSSKMSNQDVKEVIGEMVKGRDKQRSTNYTSVVDCKLPHESVSRFVAKIGPDGGRVEILGFELDFPRGAFLEMEEVSISVDNNPKNYPKTINSVPVTVIAPILGIKTVSQVLKPVTIIISTWFCACEENSITAMLAKKVSDGPWKAAASLPLNTSYEIQITVDHFCKAAPVVPEKGASRGEYKISNKVFIEKNTAMMQSVFYLDHEKTWRDVRNQMLLANNCHFCAIPLEFICKRDENLQVAAEITSPIKKKITDILPMSVNVNELVKLQKSYVQLHPKIDSVVKEFKGMIEGMYQASQSVGGSSKKVFLKRQWPIHELDPEDTTPIANVTAHNISAGVIGGNAHIKDSDVNIQAGTPV